MSRPRVGVGTKSWLTSKPASPAVPQPVFREAPVSSPAPCGSLRPRRPPHGQTTNVKRDMQKGLVTCGAVSLLRLSPPPLFLFSSSPLSPAPGAHLSGALIGTQTRAFCSGGVREGWACSCELPAKGISPAISTVDA